MGLAAKMAAAGGAYAVANAGVNQYQQHQQAQQPQQGYGGEPPPGQYGAPPHPHQFQQQPPQDNSAFAGMLGHKLNTIVATNGLQAFYPPQVLQALLAQLQTVDFRGLAARWNVPVELALDFAALALYDICVYVDDSASMKFAEKGERIDDLKAILERVTQVSTLFDADGISIRAMNFQGAADGVKDSSQAAAFLSQLKYNAGTPLGTCMQSRILKPLLLKRIKDKSLRKPLLVMTITDGEPTGEPENLIRHVIKGAKKDCQKSAYGGGAVAFEFAQVGRDEDAQKFLARLDNDKDVGKMVDCTSYYELEQTEYARKGVNLTPDLWLAKLLLGAVDRSYDEQDGAC